MQKCPICNGAGLVPWPTWVTDEIPERDSVSGLWKCSFCSGLGRIYTEKKDKKI